MPIETRPATADDASFLAWVMQEAARSHLEQGIWDFAFPGEDEPRLEILAKIITTERIHFAHFSRFRVLEIDGEPASALAAYENSQHGMEQLTLGMAEVFSQLGWSLEEMLAKGWSNHGVCTEKLWPYDPKHAGRISPDSALDARHRPLGAYYLENGWDCWVARLGVPIVSVTRGEASVRERARFDYVPYTEVDGADISGHLVHSGDDGQLEKRGRFANDAQDVHELVHRRFAQTTAGWGRRRLLLYAHGGLNNAKHSASRIASMKSYFLANEIYPVHFMWESGIVESALGAVRHALGSRRAAGIGDRFPISSTRPSRSARGRSASPCGAK